MPSVIAYHEVDDQQHWLASGNREKFFGPLGVTGIREFVDPENPRVSECSWRSRTWTR